MSQRGQLCQLGMRFGFQRVDVAAISSPGLGATFCALYDHGDGSAGSGPIPRQLGSRATSRPHVLLRGRAGGYMALNSRVERTFFGEF